MHTFISLLDEVVTHGKWRNRAAFAASGGLSPAYLSEIFSGTKLPTQEALAKWCAAAGVAAEDAQRLGYLLSRDRALKSDDTRPFVEAADARLLEMHKIVVRLSELVAKHGLKVPKDLLKSIEATDIKD